MKPPDPCNLSCWERVCSVETSKEELERLMEHYPRSFLSNPVVAIYLLEDPGWEAPRIAHRLVAVQQLWRRLPSRLEDWIASPQGGGSYLTVYGDGDATGKGSDLAGGYGFGYGAPADGVSDGSGQGSSVNGGDDGAGGGAPLWQQT